MRPPPAAVRRSVIDPLWIPLAAALVLLLLLAAGISLLTAPLDGRLRTLRLAVFGALYIALDAGLLMCCAALWLRHPVRGRRNEWRWSRAHESLLRSALSLLVTAARLLLGFAVEVREPPDSNRIAGRRLLVLARHGGPGDSFALLNLLMSRYRRRPAIVAKETLRWDPGLDVLLGRLPSCFVRRGKTSRVPGQLAELAGTMRPDDAILLFPEGGNWTPHRHRLAIAKLRRAGRRHAAADAADNPHVLPPQSAGLLACLAGQPDLDIMLVAHTGLDDIVSPALAWRAVPVSGTPMVVRWWHEGAAELPDTEEDRRQWLRLQWAIVDAWIDSRKAAGGQPGQQTGGAPIADQLSGPVAKL